MQVKHQTCVRQTPAHWEIEGLVLTILMASLVCSWGAMPRVHYRASLDASMWHLSHAAVTLHTPLPPATASIQLTGPSYTMTSPAATPCLSRPPRGDHQATSACITLTLQKDFLSKAQVAQISLWVILLAFECSFQNFIFGTYGTLPHKQAGPGQSVWLLPQPVSSNQTHGVRV